MHLPLQAYRRMKYMVSAWKESKELDVRAIAFQLISIFNWVTTYRPELCATFCIFEAHRDARRIT